MSSALQVAQSEVVARFLPKAPKPIYASQRTAVSVEVSRSGSAIIISEKGEGGAVVPRRIVSAAEMPFFADMRLPNGDWVTVEVRHYKAADLPEDFDDDTCLLSNAVAESTPLKTPGRRCNLLQFSED